jgi:hypothetical protein
MKTFLDVFPQATFWYVKNHGLLVARKGPLLIDFELLEKKMEDPFVREDLSSIDINSPEELLSLLLMGPDEISAYVNAEEDVPLNTDDYPYLEYFVPGDLFHQPIENVRQLVEYQANPGKQVYNLPEDAAETINSLVLDRKARLVNEMLENPS